MTDSQVRQIAKGDQVEDRLGRLWTAAHDAFVPPRDTVNAQVSLVRRDGNTRWVHILTCESTEF